MKEYLVLKHIKYCLYKNAIFANNQDDYFTIVNTPRDEKQQIEKEPKIIDPSQISVSSELCGPGFFSQVSIGNYNGKKVACKCYQLKNFKSDMFYNEIANLKLLNPHQSVPEIYAILKLDSFYYIIMEWVNGTTLENYLNNNPNFLFSVLRKIVKALAYMHSIENKYRIKFVDFGISRNNDPKEQIQCKGKRGWIATELNGQTRADLNEKTDVYSFSVLLKEIFASNILWDSFLGIDWYKIYSKCSDTSQSQRLTFEKILGYLN
ncbi:hypothetical protein DICPUDRAFT_78473 [Dictyostelium purpureum]|uniref:Protein kinase domain-containing protein n=1 Tax=Dictyostelium purpureum TaxID=5786 RepID=F0ZJN4_DICPU|nr:uncharacterized protein DICPUDRAFT_78473 [Dictyostelium purpureum]EGC35846.1 hypothetical protein DICPUDRAFT_78473 [Dictyostelium purpureum]|eukprot:XP_003287635.1 hypothetical protein DICPUDRAFT_78473 [Dictyostelium purpureum]